MKLLIITKRALSLLLVFLTVCTCLPVYAFTNDDVSIEGRLPFEDVEPNQWYTDGIIWCYLNEYMAGVSDTVFGRKDNVTRAMFATILVKIDGADVSGYKEMSFADVKPGQWYSNAIEWAYQNDYAAGLGEGIFGYKLNVSREQIALFFYSYSSINGIGVTAEADLSKFTDLNQVHFWALDAVEWAVAEGLIGGTSETTLAPRTSSTRAEIALIVKKYIEYVSNDSDNINGTTEPILSDNLFDKSLILGAGVFSYDISFYELVEGGHSRYAYVPLRGAGTYRTKFNWAEHKWSGARIALTNENNEWVTNATGTITKTDDDSAYDFEFTVTQEMIDQGAVNIAFDCWVNNLNTIMIVKDREYPDTYIPYGYIKEEDKDNILYGKTAIFLGDSICAGNTTLADAKEFGYGWGGLIGEANSMSWLNCGMDGGTVTKLEEVHSSLWLTTQLDKAYSTYNNVDYVIFEGGCNDADRMGDDFLGEISSDNSTLDTSTFSGAFETLVLKILYTYPNAKIGYVIPPKMYPVDDHTSNGHVHRRFFDRAIEICDKYNISVIDLWNDTPLNPNLTIYYDKTLTADQANEQEKYYTDSQHLTLTGYKYISPIIEEFMRNLSN